MPTSKMLINKTQTSDQLYQPTKTKTKWTSKETYYTLKSFIDLVQHDISKQVKRSTSPIYQMESMKH